MSLSNRIKTAGNILLTIAETEIPMPADLEEEYNYAFSDNFKIELEEDNVVRVEASFYTSEYAIPEGYKAEALSFDRLRVIRRAIGGRWDKEYLGSYVQYIQDFNGVRVTLECSRAATCKKVVTGVREIPEQVIPAKVIPARTEEIVEWECD